MTNTVRKHKKEIQQRKSMDANKCSAFITSTTQMKHFWIYIDRGIICWREGLNVIVFIIISF